MLQSSFQQYKSLNSNSSIRINVVIKDDESKKVSIIAKHNIKIQDLKRKIQKQYQQLLNFRLIVGLIEDREGFTISNNSYIGEHIQNGATIFIIPEKIDLNRQMNLSSDLQQNFLTQRFVTNSFASKMAKIIVAQQSIIADILPQMLYLGFWFSNKEVIMNVAKILVSLSEGARMVEYFDTDDIIKQKGLLLTLLEFWIRSMNVIKQKDFFMTVIRLILNLSRIEKFCSACKAHSFLQTLLSFSRNQGIQTIYQNQIQKIINSIVKGKSNRKLYSEMSEDNFKQSDKRNANSAIVGEGANQKYDFSFAFQMLKSQSLQTKNFGLEIFQSNKKMFAAEILSQNDTLSKMHEILSNQMSKISQKTIIQFITEITKRISKQKAIQMLHHNFLPQMNRMLQESSPSYHSQLNLFIKKIGEVAQYQGSVENALKFINNPYKILQQLSLRIIESALNGDHKILKQTISKYMKEFIIACLDKEASVQTITLILNIINNTLLDDQSRIQFLALKGVEVLTKMIYHPEVDIQRLSAKGLLNISLSTRQNKIKVLSSLSNYLENMFRNRVDKVVEGYLTTMIQRK